MKFYEMSASQIAEGIRKKEFSSIDVTRSCLERAKSCEDDLNAVITFSEEKALEKADKIDRSIAAGDEPGPMAGVPFMVKDNMCTAGIETTCASRMLKGWISPYSATVIELMEDAGAVLLGKTNMDEFAMGSSCEFSCYGPSYNPWNTSRVPGGSSGGSAAAVSAGYVPIALGSDTGGSIRQPASFCGIYGLKPTYGMVSRYGVVPFASSLDQVGPLARTIEDIALSLQVLSVADDKDSTCSRAQRPDFLSSLSTDSLKGKRIGVVKEFRDYDLPPDIRREVEKTLSVLEGAGATIVEVSFPVTMTSGLGSYYIIAPAEASSNLARFDGVKYGFSEKSDDLLNLYMKTRKEGFGAEVKRRILTGTYVLSSGYYDAYYLAAQKVRHIITEEFEQAFSGVDSIVMPTCPQPAFKIGELADDPVQMYMMDVFTLPVNLAGLPALSLNAGFSDEGLPVGVQLVGQKWKETELLSQARVLEDTFGPSIIANGGVVK